MTQLDIIRQQAQSAARSAAARAESRLHRDVSLVNQAARFTGRAVRQGEAAWKRHGEIPRRGRPAPGETVEERPRAVRPAGDGYVRRSPVQPVFQAADYWRKKLLRGVGVVLLVVLICVGLSLLRQLGVFGR